MVCYCTPERRTPVCVHCHQHMVGLIESLHAELEAVKQQRDELATICRNVVSRGIGASDVKAMRDALAKVGTENGEV